MARKCSWPECDSPHEAKGFCIIHYRKERRRLKLDQGPTKEYLKAHGRSPAGRYVALRRAAKDTGLEFDISKEEHLKLINVTCGYCGGPLNPSGHGLDRKDPQKGYLLNNVISCCYSCNKIKSNLLTHEEMLIAMQAVLGLRASKA